METNSKKKIIELCKEDKCTGCFACFNACPKQCISMVAKSSGSLIPKITYDQCISCGQCQRVCPELSNVTLNTPNAVFAAYSKNNQVHVKSASGGVATELAKYFIESNGVVYGAANTDSLKVEHIRVDNLEDLIYLQGSKYVQSFIGDTYKKISNDLVSGRQVLFFGTPCQIAGLQNFCKNKNTEKLYCVDLICHGTPSAKTFLECMQEETGIFDFGEYSLTFRDEDGWEIKIRNKKTNSVIRRNLKNSYYYNGFMEGYIYRQNCYSCRYANPNRCGDITLGDFWGLGAKESFDGSQVNGINVVLINSEKGTILFNNIKDRIEFWKRTLEEAVAGNGQLRSPSKDSKTHQKFLKYSEKYGDNAKAIKKCNPSKTRILKFRNFVYDHKTIYAIMRKIPGVSRKI